MQKFKKQFNSISNRHTLACDEIGFNAYANAETLTG
jgi:hypothetical protein